MSLIDQPTVNAVLVYVESHPGCGGAEICAAIYPGQRTYRSTGRSETIQIMRVLVALDVVAVETIPAGADGQRLARHAYRLAPLGQEIVRRKGLVT